MQIMYLLLGWQRIKIDLLNDANFIFCCLCIGFRYAEILIKDNNLFPEKTVRRNKNVND